MKFLLLPIMMMTFCLNSNLKAEDVKIPNSITINQPRYNGKPFLALDASQYYNFKESSAAEESMKRRAGQVCKMLGYGVSIASTLTYSHVNIQLLTIDAEGNIIPDTYFKQFKLTYSPYEYRDSSIAYFDTISCKLLEQEKNSTQKLSLGKKDNNLIQKLTLENEQLKKDKAVIQQLLLEVESMKKKYRDEENQKKLDQLIVRITNLQRGEKNFRNTSNEFKESKDSNRK